MNRKLSDYKRLFTFGCSMTRYRWPTWADILSKEIPNFYNYGKSGGGNLFISNSIVEANMVHKFNEDDLIMVMWSSIHREDRYKENEKWITPGNIYTQGWFDTDWVAKWADDKFHLLRDLGLIELSRKYLSTLPCESHMLTMCEISAPPPGGDKANVYQEIESAYKETIESLHPDICKTVYNGRWPSTPISGHGQTADYHPTPAGHLKYLETIFPNMEVTENMKNFTDEFEGYVQKFKVFSRLEQYWKEGGYWSRL